MKTPTPESLYKEMLKTPSSSMEFRVTRDPEPGRTFSAEALDTTLTAMRMWVGSRLARDIADRAEGLGPRDLRIEVKVTLDGRTVTVPDDEYPWYVVDGANRNVR